MTKFLLRTTILINLIFAVTGCKQPSSPATYEPAKFHNFLQNYWHGLLMLQPLDAIQFGDSSMNDQFRNTCTQAYRDERTHFYSAYLDSLQSFNPDSMNEQDLLSYKILKFDAGIEIERAGFDTWKIPFTQFGDAGNTLSGNIILAMGQLGSGESSQPFKTVNDYHNWLKRVSNYPAWCDSAIGNFRAGMATNYVLPKSLVVKMINICNGLLSADVTKSIFYGPIRNLPSGFTQTEKDSLTNAYVNAITRELNPAHERMVRFLKNEYLPKARATSGVSDLPNGLDYYKLCVRRWTTTDKSLDEIYNTGLSEVKRIRELMEATKSSTGFTGTLDSFFLFTKTSKQFMPFKTAKEVLDSFRHIYEIIKPNIPKYFVLFPRSQFEIRQTEAFRAASASIEYFQGSPDGKRPGIFYVPILNPATFNITSGMESTFLHEAVPGHHYQVSLQMEDSTLPTFRRFKWYGAYGEGWALYSESLGKELGLYKNPFQLMGALGDEMHRAIRLVVDVAIHSKGMSREEAIKYMMENEAIDEQGATAEIERYMAEPGQALSYKIGAMKIRELREKYTTQMGSNFNIGEFHKEVLNRGCLPLLVMEDKLNRWAAGITAK